MMSRCRIRQQIRFVQKLFSLWRYVDLIFVEPDTFVASEVRVGVFGEGTRLAMPKTICAAYTSSLKPGSGATEGVLD